MTPDPCLSLFWQVWDTHVLGIPTGALVLEIGCAEADWMAEFGDRAKIVGIDVRPCQRDGGYVIQGDVLSANFSDAVLDAVVAISTIEHIGLGHYGDPVDPDGDVHCMERVARWLKPGGVFYADVPYGAEFGVNGTSYRVYDDAALKQRIIEPGSLIPLRQFWRRHSADSPLAEEPLYPERPAIGRDKHDLVYTALVCERV